MCRSGTVTAGLQRCNTFSLACVAEDEAVGTRTGATLRDGRDIRRCDSWGQSRKPLRQVFNCSIYNRAVVCMMSACMCYGSMRERCDSCQVSTMKVNEVVRNKEDREAMKASACDQCNQFYASVLLCCLFTPSTLCSFMMFRSAYFCLAFTRLSQPCLQPSRSLLQQNLQEQISYSLLHQVPPASMQHTLTRPS